MQKGRGKSEGMKEAGSEGEQRERKKVKREKMKVKRSG